MSGGLGQVLAPDSEGEHHWETTCALRLQGCSTHRRRPKGSESSRPSWRRRWRGWLGGYLTPSSWRTRRRRWWTRPGRRRCAFACTIHTWHAIGTEASSRFTCLLFVSCAMVCAMDTYKRRVESSAGIQQPAHTISAQWCTTSVLGDMEAGVLGRRPRGRSSWRQSSGSWSRCWRWRPRSEPIQGPATACKGHPPAHRAIAAACRQRATIDLAICGTVSDSTKSP